MTTIHNPTIHNPAFHEEPVNQPVRTLTPVLRESLFSWLESTGRFHSTENEFQEQKILEDLDSILEPEIYALENEENGED